MKHEKRKIMLHSRRESFNNKEKKMWYWQRWITGEKYRVLYVLDIYNWTQDAFSSFSTLQLPSKHFGNLTLVLGKKKTRSILDKQTSTFPPSLPKTKKHQTNSLPISPSKWVVSSACPVPTGAINSGAKSASSNGRIMSATNTDSMRSRRIVTETWGRMVLQWRLQGWIIRAGCRGSRGFRWIDKGTKGAGNLKRGKEGGGFRWDEEMCKDSWNRREMIMISNKNMIWTEIIQFQGRKTSLRFQICSQPPLNHTPSSLLPSTRRSLSPKS